MIARGLPAALPAGLKFSRGEAGGVAHELINEGRAAVDGTRAPLKTENCR